MLATVLQRLLLALSRAEWAQRAITRVPVTRRVARRFVAGETLEAALEAIQALNRLGLRATLDFLGESVRSREEACAAGDEYLRALEAIHRTGVQSGVSIKLTQFGLDIDESFCADNVRRVVARAQQLGNFVCVDMESTAYTDRTLALIRALRRDFSAVGAVLQAYLYRTEQDLLALAEAGIQIRLCKGAYAEPPSKAFPRKQDVDANYQRLIPLLLDHAAAAAPAQDGRVPPLAAFATHDERMIESVKTYARAQRIPRDRFEFQLLYGVRRDLQLRLAQEGYAVRVYVPYGTHWYPYFMRRLAERPANLWFFVRSLFAR
ncbi:MAG: proline dehydrogenase family protein [Anaerolineae bacterium]|nr:proline dehydrogenase family protein [Anaerolineae bacterium]